MPAPEPAVLPDRQRGCSVQRRGDLSVVLEEDEKGKYGEGKGKKKIPGLRFSSKTGNLRLQSVIGVAENLATGI